MPTGYTHNVCDGTLTEFADFALQCARAFGACIEMRDDPMDKAIPDEFKPSQYHAEGYVTAKERLAHLQSLTPEQAEVEAFAAWNEASKSANEANARMDAQNERLAAMISKVEAWTPPTGEHRELKKFMLQQLDISKSTYRHEEPKRLGGDVWLASETRKAQRDLDYHAEEQRKENERAASRTAWVKSLRESLA